MELADGWLGAHAPMFVCVVCPGRAISRYLPYISQPISRSRGAMSRWCVISPSGVRWFATVSRQLGASRHQPPSRFFADVTSPGPGRPSPLISHVQLAASPTWLRSDSMP